MRYLWCDCSCNIRLCLSSRSERGRVQSRATLRRLLAYLGATLEQLADFDNCHGRWGQATVRCAVSTHWMIPAAEKEGRNIST